LGLCDGRHAVDRSGTPVAPLSLIWRFTAPVTMAESAAATCIHRMAP